MENAATQEVKSSWGRVGQRGQGNRGYSRVLEKRRVQAVGMGGIKQSRKWKQEKQLRGRQSLGCGPENLGGSHK